MDDKKILLGKYPPYPGKTNSLQELEQKMKFAFKKNLSIKPVGNFKNYPALYVCFGLTSLLQYYILLSVVLFHAIYLKFNNVVALLQLYIIK
jgi:hypothetical protein